MASQRCNACKKNKNINEIICIQEGEDISSREFLCISCHPEYSNELNALWSSPKVKLSKAIIKKIDG
jgi:hypothetical protein